MDLFRDDYIDISPTLSPKTAVYPGDTPFSAEIIQDIHQGAPYHLSTLNMTAHMGAHTDAPLHYDAQGVDMAKQVLGPYVGPCQVMEIKGRHLIEPSDLGDIVQPRILFRTDSFNPYQWREDFTALHPDTVDALAQRGVKLVGIDTPSVDPAQAKPLVAHSRFKANGVSILEGITLTRAQAGVYTLMCLPLPIEGGDASPVRAILLPLS